MNCLKLGNVFKCEYCKYVNISLILILFYLGQIISLNDAVKSTNETKKLTNVSKNQLNNKIDLTDHLSDTSSKINASNSNSNSTKIYNNRNSTTRIISKQNRQLEKHFYNITLPPVNSTNHSSSSTTNSFKYSNKTLDEFDVSESRISRFDEEPAGEEEQEQQHPLSFLEDDSVDGASSNLNEQKVVKELTKILSKGMSGATDQVKLDTLEQWKRRQRERKVVKDSRAKLFEDLLTAAINTHPEKVKKKTKKRSNKQQEKEDKQNLGSYSPILSSYPNLDPELSSDAETVIQHLQGLASVIDGQTPAFSPGAKLESSSGDSLSGGGGGVDELSSNDNYSSSDGYTNNDSDSPSDEKTSNKKIVSSSSDRPIVKQFKQIKHKISQRRKQLDQIKKIFNVDLSLNKDGSLQGKTSSKKKETASSEVNEEYSNSDEGEAPKVKKKSSKRDRDKMQDLMSYLKENPEILASVMDELTANTEFSSTKLSPVSESDTLFQNSQQLDDNQLNYPSMSRKIYSTRQNPDFDTNNNNWDRAYRKSNHRIYSDISTHDLANSLRRQRLRNNIADNFSQNDDNIVNINANNRLVPLNEKPFSAEALLLESLRERQLMNLARLDRVLAERYQASNRSHVYSSLNQSGRTTSNFSPRTHLLPPSQQQQQQQQVTATSDHRHGDVVDQMQRHVPNNRINNHPSANQRQFNQQNNTRSNPGQSDEEVLHHFMVMNQPTHPSSGHDIVEDSIVQQQNQLLSKPYNPRLQQQSQQLQQLQQQQQYPQLNRFRDWRDVSHSEASPSQRSDKTNFPINMTRPQFDPTRGAIDAHGSPSVHLNNYQLPSFSRTPNPTNDHHYDTKNYADSVVTKPGTQVTNSFQNNHQPDYTIRPLGSNFIRDRPSALRSESKSQPVVNANTYSETDLNDGDSKSSSRRRETTSDDDESPERTRATNSNSPTDYFSAYKRTNQNGSLDYHYNNNNNHHEVSQTSNLKEKSQHQQQDLESDQNESESDGNDSGAMWAR